MIIDVLLKYFFRDVYDKDCCKEGCNCPEGSSIECEGSSDSKEENYDILVKLFKPEESDDLTTKDVETSNDNISENDQQEIASIVQQAMDKINGLLFGN